MKQKSRKSCGVIIKRDDRYLCIQSGWNQPWGFPKGGTENSETEKETALRELREELGLILKETDLKERFEQNNTRKDIVLFLVDYNSLYPNRLNKFLKIQHNIEVYSHSWFTLEELKNIQFIPNQLKILEIL